MIVSTVHDTKGFWFWEHGVLVRGRSGFCWQITSTGDEESIPMIVFVCCPEVMPVVGLQILFSSHEVALKSLLGRYSRTLSQKRVSLDPLTRRSFWSEVERTPAPVAKPGAPV